MAKTVESIYIPVRYGIKLAATIYYPYISKLSPSIPIVWKHDRYHTRNQPAEERPVFEHFKNMMLSNDIVAIVDSRGSSASYV